MFSGTDPKKEEITWENEQNWHNRFFELYQKMNRSNAHLVTRQVLNLIIENYAGNIQSRCNRMFKVLLE